MPAATIGQESTRGVPEHSKNTEQKVASSAKHAAVFDLPQLYTRPSAEELREVLDLLKLQPRSWERRRSSASKRRSSMSKPVFKRAITDTIGLTNYLTSIIASSLKWIDDDVVREQIWEAASARLSERSGRSAMPSITRSFQISTDSGVLNIQIHEPALTADNLGFKTWAASYLLSKRLASLGLAGSLLGDCASILELGAGTGLVGIAAAQIFGTSVLLTDLPEIEPNLKKNANLNRAAIRACGAAVFTGTLDWSLPECLEITGYSESIKFPQKFPVIIAADCVYSAEHPPMLVDTIRKWLSPVASARVVTELPIRNAYTPELDDFRQRLVEAGLCILDEGNEVGYDDWGTIDGDLEEVQCWWSVWTWTHV